jgi:predicted phosphate transport protein (TIGR00153 family)
MPRIGRKGGHQVRKARSAVCSALTGHGDSAIQPGIMHLLPREESFFDEFEKHAQKTVEGCRTFVEMAQGKLSSSEACPKIKSIESDCDHITHHVVERLHKVFITPIDRNDIFRLISKMDDVMDFVEAAAQRVALYGVESNNKELWDLTRVLLTGAERLSEAVCGLRNLKHPDLILEKCVEINRLENEADVQLRGVIAKLFKEEKNPIEVIKWKEIFELLETATDRCEDVANIIEGVVLENS